MRLHTLAVADDPETWAALGFAADGGVVALDGVAIVLAGRGAGEGILGWSVDGLTSDVLPRTEPVPATPAVEHPNGALAVDHVVAVAGDFDAATASLAADGLEARRVRDVPGGETRQAFYVLETALLELAGPVQDVDGVRFWGLTVVVADLDALAARLGDRLGPAKDAVQPGRRIATLRREAHSSVPLAFMTPR
ncbi:MAG: Glyoxalase/bleomycin resistance protein/dioxygenase [Solirubrobacteraceae bacterium]|nr:Glyoxalase/bleomycin resistance protein/dioxygenase [Solirubrobacteraceae bacterium]